VKSVWLAGCLFLAALALLPASCTPKYPKCDKDEQCKKGEVCVNGQCQQCREDRDCPKGQRCNAGRCESKASRCDGPDDCAEGQACIDGRCAPCEVDADCQGGRCKGGRCIRPRRCKTDDDCPQNHECQDGICVAPPSDGSGRAPCRLEPVYFGFDEFVLTDETTRKLQAAVRCINSVTGRGVRIEGHCDSRGTEEYNLALGDRRAQSVKRYLVRLGVAADRLHPVSKGKLEAAGTDAASWAMDRKVQFYWE